MLPIARSLRLCSVTSIRPKWELPLRRRSRFRGTTHHEKPWQAVRAWHFEQSGKCADCGTRLELQADHVVPKEEAGEEADRLENMTLRCRRCNVVRRPSHKLGGKTLLTTESALMWLLFTKRPTDLPGIRETVPRLRTHDGEHSIPGRHGRWHVGSSERAGMRSTSTLRTKWSCVLVAAEFLLDRSVQVSSCDC